MCSKYLKIIVTALGMSFISFFCPPATTASIPLTSTKVNIGKHSFTVELALSEAQQEQGLMFRKKLAANEGMLFVMKESRVITMWMKNTLIPLDMIFIDATGQVIYIKDHATPESEAVITSPIPAKAVLEVAGGTCKKLGINVGDKVAHATFTHTAH